MSANRYSIGDGVEIYVDGSFRGRGKFVDVSLCAVRVKFFDQNESAEKTFECEIGNTLNRNAENGYWVIDVPAPVIYDLR
jgi:hypothetical protein